MQSTALSTSLHLYKANREMKLGIEADKEEHLMHTVLGTSAPPSATDENNIDELLRAGSPLASAVDDLKRAM